jgi:hypothetical protein
MSRVIIILGLAISCVITAVLNVVIERITSLSIYGLHVWFIIPIGAAMVGMASAFGGILAARLFNAAPKWIDALSMVICSALAMYLIYYIDYKTYVINGSKVSDFVDFQKFVEISLTEAHMRVGRVATDTGAVGTFGYILAAIDFIGFLFGGLITFGLLMAMDRCKTCEVYLRKIATTNSGVVTEDEAIKLLHVFKNGNFGDIEYILSWQAPHKRKFGKGQNLAKLNYTLYACPICKKEQVTETMSVSNGGSWKEVSDLKFTRISDDGLSLRKAIKAPKNNDLSVFG